MPSSDCFMSRYSYDPVNFAYMYYRIIYTLLRPFCVYHYCHRGHTIFTYLHDIHILHKFQKRNPKRVTGTSRVYYSNFIFNSYRIQMRKLSTEPDDNVLSIHVLLQTILRQQLSLYFP